MEQDKKIEPEKDQDLQSLFLQVTHEALLAATNDDEESAKQALSFFLENTLSEDQFESLPDLSDDEYRKIVADTVIYNIDELIQYLEILTPTGRFDIDREQ